MDKHTPGPWRTQQISAGMYDIVDDDKDTAIAVDVDDAANARLIAAAPRLLNALQRISTEPCDHGPGFCAREYARDILRAEGLPL